MQWMYRDTCCADTAREIVKKSPRKHPLIVQRGKNWIRPRRVHPDLEVANHPLEEHAHGSAQEYRAPRPENSKIRESQDGISALEWFKENAVSSWLEGVYRCAYDFLRIHHVMKNGCANAQIEASGNIHIRGRVHTNG